MRAFSRSGMLRAVGELDDIVAQLEPSLGPLEGEPQPLEGGITNRNFRVRFGGRDYVVRLHGKDTELLGISREAERLANEAAAALGIAPAVAARFDGGLVTRFVSLRAARAPASSPARVGEIARGAARVPRLGRRAAGRASGCPTCSSDYARDRARARRRRCRAAYATRPRSWPRASPRRCRSRAPRPCHNDLLAGQPDPRRGRRPDA